MGSFSLFHWIILAVIVAVIYSATRGLFSSAVTKGDGKFCTQCGNTGGSVTKTKGSFAIEVLLWICFLIPGLIYSIWRLTTRHEACPKCGAANLIPADSPMARKLGAP